jgi:hypothetical protein
VVTTEAPANNKPAASRRRRTSKQEPVRAVQGELSVEISQAGE